MHAQAAQPPSPSQLIGIVRIAKWPFSPFSREAKSKLPFSKVRWAQQGARGDTPHCLLVRVPGLRGTRMTTHVNGAVYAGSRGRHTPLPACSRPGSSGYAGDNTRQWCSVCKQQGTTHCLLPACSRPGFSGYAGDNTRQWCCVCKELENNGQFLWTPVSGGKSVQALDSFVALS